MTQQQVATALGVTRQVIWNLETSALKKVRKILGIPEPRRRQCNRKTKTSTP